MTNGWTATPEPLFAISICSVSPAATAAVSVTAMGVNATQFPVPPVILVSAYATVVLLAPAMRFDTVMVA